MWLGGSTVHLDYKKKLERYYCFFLVNILASMSFSFTALPMHVQRLQFYLFLDKGVGGRGQSYPNYYWVFVITKPLSETLSVFLVL